jgi:hypothetical protein
MIREMLPGARLLIESKDGKKFRKFSFLLAAAVGWFRTKQYHSHQDGVAWCKH